jgi:gluconate 2-dehydrogenase gamma chain
MLEVATLDRRDLLKRIALLLGSAALPASVALSAARGPAQRFLSPAQFKLLSAVADTIIPRTDTPGAVQAGVPRLVDGLLANWASPRRRAEMIAAMERIDRLALSSNHKRFALLAPMRRQELLRPHDVAALKPVPRTDGLTGIGAFLAGPTVADNGYGKLKELIVVLYYSSRIGLTQELTYSHAPGKWQPSVPVAPGTRPAGAGGPF